MIDIPITLLATHFVGDFILQSDWMALNKSKNLRALVAHVLIYSLCFLPFGVIFAMITFLTHLITDAATSQITSKLWFIELDEQYDTGRRDGVYFARHEARVFGDRRHWFFVAIGADQLIHYITLGATYTWLMK